MQIFIDQNLNFDEF